MISFALRLDSPRLAPPIDVGYLIEQATARAGMTHKEVCDLTGYDRGNWSRALDGKPGYALDLWKLAHLPWRWWSVFIPLLVTAQTEAWLEHLRADRKERLK